MKHYYGQQTISSWLSDHRGPRSTLYTAQGHPPTNVKYILCDQVYTSPAQSVKVQLFKSITENGVLNMVLVQYLKVMEGVPELVIFC